MDESLISALADIANTKRLRRNELDRLRYAAKAAAKAAASASAAVAVPVQTPQVNGIRDENGERQRLLHNEGIKLRRAAARALQHQAGEADDQLAERQQIDEQAVRLDTTAMRQAAAAETSRQNRLRASAEYSRRRRHAFMEVRQQWDHAHPCRYCGRVWLVSSSEVCARSVVRVARCAILSSLPSYCSPCPLYSKQDFSVRTFRV